MASVSLPGSNGEKVIDEKEIQEMIRTGQVPREKIPDAVENLLEAAQKGSVSQLTKILSGSPAELINETDAKKRTALHFAALTNKPNVIKVLLEKGAQLNLQDTEGYTPAALALKAGNTAILDTLGHAGADLTIANKTGVTPLHLAVTNGDKDVVKKVIEWTKGKKGDAKDAESGSPLHFACERPDPEFADILLENDSALMHSVDSNGMTPLHIACAYNNSKVALRLLEHGANPNAAAKGSITPLHIAADTGNKALVRAMLDRGALLRIDSSGATPLIVARRNKDKELEEMLQNIKLDESTVALDSAVADNSSVDERASPEKLKERGNEAFAKKEYDMALEWYSLAIQVDSIVQEIRPYMQGRSGITHILYSNRSTTHYHLRKFAAALEDANTAIELAPDWPKGYVRKHAALRAMHRNKEAEEVEAKIKQLEAGPADK